MKTKAYLALLLVICLALNFFSFPVFASVSASVTDGDTVTIQTSNYVVKVEKAGFRYGFYKPDGTTAIAAPHSESGLCFGPAGETPYNAKESTYLGMNQNVAKFEVTNTQGDKAQVEMKLFEHYVRLSIAPEKSSGIQSITSNLSEQSLLSALGGETGEGYLNMQGTRDSVNATVYRLCAGTLPGDYVIESDVRMKAGSTRSVGIYAHYTAPNAFQLFYIKPGTGIAAMGLKRLDPTATVDFASGITAAGKAMTLTADTWYHLKMVVQGKTMQCYIDGTLVVSATDTGATAAQLTGGCGIRADKTDANFDNLKVSSVSSDTTYFSMDFNSAENMDKWKNTKWETMLGSSDAQYVTADGTAQTIPDYNPANDKYLWLKANPKIFATVKGGEGWTDETVCADTSLTLGDELTAAALLARYTDENNYYAFGFLGLGTVSILKKTNGAETVLATVPFDYQYDTFYSLKIEVVGNTLTGYVNGTEVLSAADSALSSGTAGVYASTTTSKTKNFTVSGSGAFQDSFDSDLTNWNLSGEGMISYDGDPAQNPEEPPAGSGRYTIDARLEGNINPMYGLGDYGAVTNTGESVRTTSNVFGVNRTAAGSFTNENGGPIRFISNFSISPQRGFAQVLFEEADKRVVINEAQTLLGVLNTEKVTTLYYFFGDMKQIYQDYRNVRNDAGYEDTRPHYEMFGLGWEAFGALGWNAYQQNVVETVQDYLDEGYNITWAVVGSGFWKGDRYGLEGTTTSFGLWDDTANPNGRNDTAYGMPNPRFPNPDSMKTFFKDKGIKLLLGLRVHFKLPEALGGDWQEEVDGNFVQEGLTNGYFLKNDDGSLLTINAKYPSGSRTRKLTAYIDGSNADALEWYRQGAALWGVDGFKEDTMVLNHDRSYNDGNWNRVLSYMIDKDDSVMIMRNGAYSLSGDILRINDANMGTSNSGFNSSPDRMPINLLAYAASGVSNVYPDIVGGTGGSITNTTFQKYLVRNAQFAALNPSLSVGINALKMDNAAYKDATFNAINWHSTYAPYIYDAALKSWSTGYPYSMTPLYIAYPDDAYTHNMVNTTAREYEWLLGESLLAAPQFGTDFNTADSRNVYLPEGTWIEYSTGETFEGPLLLPNRAHPINQIPAFVGGKGVLVGEDMENKGNYFVEVFPIANNGSRYEYTFVDGTSKSVVTNNNTGWSPATLHVRDTTTNQEVAFTYNSVNRSIKFDYTAGHNYELTGGESSHSLVSAAAFASTSKIAVGQTGTLTISGGLCDDGTAADLSSAAYLYHSGDSTVLSVDAAGKITALKEGKTQVWADVTLNNGLGQPVTVATNRIDIEVLAPSVRIVSPAYAEDSFDAFALTGWKNLAPEESYSITSYNGEKALHYAGAGRSGDRGTLLLGEDSWTDYTVEADITVPNVVSGKTVGLTLRYQNYNSCYILGYTHGSGFRYIKRNGDGGNPSVTTVQVPFSLVPGQTYHFKAVAKGATCSLYIDESDEPVLSVTDNAAAAPVYTYGAAGIYSSGMDAYYQNFKISQTVEALPVSIAGTSFGAASVALSIDGRSLTAVPDAEGKWSFSVAGLQNGTYTAAVSIKNTAGQTTAQTSVPVRVQAPNDGLDRSALTAALQAAQAKRPAAGEIGTADGQIPPEAAAAFEKALADAQAILGSAVAQEELTQAAEALGQAVAALESSRVGTDKTPLLQAIQNAKTALSNGNYTALSKQALLAVITEAELAVQQNNLNQEQIGGYVSRINAAIAQLAAIPSGTPSVSEPPAPDRGLILPSSRDWSDIRTHLAQSTAGALVRVEMNGGTTVPQDALAAIQENRISLVLNMGNYQWILRGEDIVSPQTLDLGVEFLGSSALYSTALREIPHDGNAIPLRLSYDGPFYSKASLRFFAGINHRNEYANLYYYNPVLKKYEFQSAVQVDTDGYITLPFSHASDYAVILSTKSAAKDLSAGAPCMDGARAIISK